MLRLKKEILEKMLAVANDHHLNGYLWLYHQEELDQNMLEECKKSYFSQWHHNQLLMNELAELQYNGHAIILKGPPLLETCHGANWGVRKSCDLDLWFSHKNEANKFRICLERSRYKLIHKGTWWGEKHKDTWALQTGLGEVVFELHQGKLFYHLADREVASRDWKDGFSVLDTEENLNYLIGHMAFQHTFSKLTWLCDIAHFIFQAKQNIDWKKVRRLAEAQQLVAAHEMTFWALETIFELPGRPWEERFNPKVSRVWQDMLHENFLIRGEQRSWAYFALKHYSKDSLWLAIAYDLLWPLGKMQGLIKAPDMRQELHP